MNGTTSIAISAAANAQAAAANAAVQEAARISCMNFVKGFNNDTATTAEMRQYAGCIDRLYPQPLGELQGTDLLVMKAVAIFLLAAMFIGIFYERKNRTFSDGIVGAVLGGGLIGILCGALGVLMIGGVFAAGMLILE